MGTLGSREARLLTELFERYGLKTFVRGDLDSAMIHSLIWGKHLENISEPGVTFSKKETQLRIHLDLPAGYEKRSYLKGVGQ